VAVDLDGVGEGLGDELGGDHIVDRAGGQHMPVAEEGGVGGAGGEFFQVVGYQDPGQVRVSGVDVVEGFQELFAGGYVETGGRFVEE
jgi:hypothetical protein